MLGPVVPGTVVHNKIAFACLLLANAPAALSNKTTRTWFILRFFILVTILSDTHCWRVDFTMDPE